MKLAIFDMDGTVFESRLDWQQIRTQLKIQPGDSILETIYRDNHIDRQRLTVLENYERQNTLQIGLIDGAPTFIDHLKTKGITVALVTNNNRENTDFLLNKYNLNFHQVITRESGLWKPEPDAFHMLMKEFQISASKTMAIGDSHYDVKAARAAAISRIFIIKNQRFPQPQVDYVTYFDDYFHLRQIMERSKILQ